MAENEWYDLDVIWRLLTSDDVATVTEPPERVAAFVRAHIDELEQLFASDRIDETVRALKDLQRRRAKELFG